MITLATLATATAQQVFNQVRDHLLAQGRRSLLYPGNEDRALSVQCAYRSPDGLKCAAGCLMSDEEYRPEFDSTLHFNRKPTSCGWVTGIIEKYKAAPLEHAGLITDLQEVHDYSPPERWSTKLAERAKAFGLDYAST